VSALPAFDSDLAGTPWDVCETAGEQQLANWVEAIARADHRSGVLAARVCAEVALPVARSSAVASGLGFAEPDRPWGASLAPVEQLDRVRRWLDQGMEIPARTLDVSRQLNIWDDDLRPPPDAPDSWFTYFVEASNLLVMAARNGDAPGAYGSWSGPVAAGRSAVCSYKAMHRPGHDRQADLDLLRAAVQSALA
jgi:hypothetical protein